LLSIDISGILIDYPKRFFTNFNVEEYDVVFYASYGCIIGIAVKLDEDDFREICRETLNMEEPFEADSLRFTLLPVAVGKISDNGNYKGYAWGRFYHLSGDSIIARKETKKYEITAKYNRQQKIAYFYYDHLILWGSKYSPSHFSAPRQGYRKGRLGIM
jgi:hypothetical protein